MQLRVIPGHLWLPGISAALLSAAPLTELVAQSKPWGLSAEAGLTHFWGGSEAVAPNDAPGLKPYRPVSVGMRLDNGLKRYRFGLGIQYASVALGQDGPDLAILLKGAMTWVQATPEIAYQLATINANSELRAFAGPLIDLWLPAGDESRVRAGGRIGLELLVPFGAGLAGLLRCHGGVSGSLFKDTEVPSEFRTKSMPNVGLALGLRLGL